MLETTARLLVYGAELYLGLGLAFAVPFAFFGAGRIDPAARGGTLGFRLLIVPASAALWPLLAWRWAKGTPPPEERNAHRDAAARVRRRHRRIWLALAFLLPLLYGAALLVRPERPAMETLPPELAAPP